MGSVRRHSRGHPRVNAEAQYPQCVVSAQGHVWQSRTMCDDGVISARKVLARPGKEQDAVSDSHNASYP